MFTNEDIIYAASSRCECGEGLAYVPYTNLPEDKEERFSWEGHWLCSKIILGGTTKGFKPNEANSNTFLDAEGVAHTKAHPFAFYEIKSEDQPSAHGATTRPKGAPPYKKPEPPKKPQIYVYKDGMSEEEQKNGAYWERNMLAMTLAMIIQNHRNIDLSNGIEDTIYGESGWYLHGEWEGWSRVISINGGQMTFHVPDDFDLGALPQIANNWDNHTTEEKWKRVMDACGVKHE